MGLHSNKPGEKVVLPLMGGALIALLTAVFILIGVLLVRQETQQHNQLKYDQVLASLNDMRESLTN